MKPSLRDLIVVLMLLYAALLWATATHAQSPVMVGAYTCEGQNPDGSAYTIHLGILGDGTKYQLTWKDQQGPLVGLGYVSGSTLSVAIATEQGQAVGLAVYAIQGQTLDGTWMAFGQAGTMTETCVPANSRQAGA